MKICFAICLALENKWNQSSHSICEYQAWVHKIKLNDESEAINKQNSTRNCHVAILKCCCSQLIQNTFTVNIAHESVAVFPTHFIATIKHKFRKCCSIRFCEAQCSLIFVRKKSQYTQSLNVCDMKHISVLDSWARVMFPCKFFPCKLMQQFCFCYH